MSFRIKAPPTETDKAVKNFEPVKEAALNPKTVMTTFLINLKIGEEQDSIHDSKSGCS